MKPFPPRCGPKRKITFTTERKALRAAMIATMKEYPLVVYECGHCGFWHLTSHVGVERF